jgi:hypothetical protein
MSSCPDGRRVSYCRIQQIVSGIAAAADTLSNGEFYVRRLIGPFPNAIYGPFDLTPKGRLK